MSQRSGRRVVALCLAALVTACESPSASYDVEIESLELLEPAAPLVQSVRVRLAAAAAIGIEYWPEEGGPRLLVQSPSARSHDVALTRLRPASAYRFEVRGTTRGGSFQTDPLPEDLVAIGLDPTGTATPPLILLHLFTADGFRGYAIVDRDNVVVWYRRTEDFPFAVARRANGNLLLMDRAAGLLEVTPAGSVVRQIAQDTAGRQLHHDVVTTPANTVLFIAHDRRTLEQGPVRGDAIWEWAPESGTVTKRWSSWDHLSIEDDRGPRFGSEWLHANSLHIGPRGNVLLGVHYFNQVISIPSDWSGIEWRLGGVNASHAIELGDEFSGQHTAQEIAPDRVLMFDNGVDHGGPSRAVEFELTEAGAEKRWEWQPSPGNYASAVGSARRLANGNTLVTFGTQAGLSGSTGPTEVWELDDSGIAVWHLVVSGVRFMYRAEPLQSIGLEVELNSGA